ncbi:MAG: SDR family oxidoreductase [Casimicrobiaceae bacterium]|nr:SDR family oxidoreductase [Casimicrobiaceae bacterium]MCX8098303.1 SDR family oxidoreductase [Casimicrobiaceae bacterium]MDW8311761.1 SDR family oxidoreductase [Burkholderiales bacterium]
MSRTLTNRYPSLEGRSVFVTGGASGLGATIVEAFVAQGAIVGFLDIDDRAANELKLRLDAKERLRYWKCDVRDVVALQRTIERSVPVLGGNLDVFVANVANDERHSFSELTPEFWDNNQAINLRAQVFGAQAAARVMGLGGSIILMGSVSWMRARPGWVSYTTAKAGIHGLARTLAQELGSQGIRVNTVVPGAIDTPKPREAALTPELEKSVLAEQALKFRLKPEDVAAMVLFLASDDARACTGQAFVVDGGLV